MKGVSLKQIEKLFLIFSKNVKLKSNENFFLRSIFPENYKAKLLNFSSGNPGGTLKQCSHFPLNQGCQSYFSHLTYEY